MSLLNNPKLSKPPKVLLTLKLTFWFTFDFEFFELKSKDSFWQFCKFDIFVLELEWSDDDFSFSKLPKEIVIKPVFAYSDFSFPLINGSSGSVLVMLFCTYKQFIVNKLLYQFKVIYKIVEKVIVL